MNIFNRSKEDSGSLTKKCPFCKEEILKDATVCKHCGKKQPNKKVQIATAVFFGFIILIIIIASSGGSKGDTSSPTPPPVVRVSVGEIGYLKAPSDSAMLATSKENFDEMIKLSVANDTDGLVQMVLKGQAILVPNGTQVRVIDQSYGAREVRILEGEYKSESGWTAMEFVVPNKQ